uniref:CSN8/PSMD8/EIF3K domain-containing protein n=1 Tax=Chinchilla lanigera TaxID=34839 RepID=A0A8C2VUM3_CHILA
RRRGTQFSASGKMAAATVNGATGISSTMAASGAVLQAEAGMYEQLKGEWNCKIPNVSKCKEKLGRLELVLLELNFLPTTGTKLTKHILRKDIPSFECSMAQLKCYCFNYKEQLSESAYMHQLLGLNFLFLLSQNCVAEIHTELEHLLAKDIRTNVHTKHPVSLEQYLMEGSYNKVFLAKGNILAENYTFSMDILLDTTRDEIAGCIEKAYEKILFTEATWILFFNTTRKMMDYAKKRGWVPGPNNYYSFTSQQQKPEDTTISSTELAKQIIEYARQLEMII